MPAVQGPDEKGDAAILKRIQTRRDLAFNAWKDSREKQLDDLKFCDLANQWPEVERAKRKDQGRPCLTVDRTNPFIDQLVNEERQNRPAINVHPIDDGADEDTAEIMQGYIRHTERNSNADFAYDRASESQKRCGFGFMRLVTEYSDENSFNQDIKILSVPNPFMYYLDPASTEPDGSDAKWGFGEEDIPADVFKSQYPDAGLAAATAAEWTSVGMDAPGWIAADGKSARVVEYYELETEPFTLCLLDGGKTCDEKDLPQGVKPTKTRSSNRTTLMWYKVCANQILDRRECPGPYIPIIPVYGKELIINGERDYRGVVRQMKDVQRMVNVWKSAQTESIGLAPKAPWVIALGSLPDGDKTWSTANTVNYSALFYKAFDANGNALPAPTRNVQEPAIQAITMALRETEEDMKAVTGMYDPALGNRGSADQSGRAIERLQQQGNTGNFHFSDNFNRSLRHVGRIIISWIPRVIDAEQLLRCVGVDDQQYQVKVNTQAPVKNPKTGLEQIYDMTSGKYDVSVVAGPSYASKRQENAEALTNLAKMLPSVQQLGPDILVRQLDFPAAKELADRVCPPQFKKEQGKDAAQGDPQAMQQLMQQHEQLTQALHEAQDQLEQQRVKADADLAKAKLDADTKLEIARMNNETAMLQTMAQIDAQKADAALVAKIQELEQRTNDHEQLMLAMHEGLTTPAQGGADEDPSAAPAGDQPQELAGPEAGMEPQ